MSFADFAHNSYRIMKRYSFHFFNRLAPDAFIIKRQYRTRIGKELNLKRPESFNEKLQWLKINYRDPVLTTLVDKYEARKYIQKCIGSEYLVPIYGVWDHFDDIDFSLLPGQFVLKCTHDSGGIVICTNKGEFDLASSRKLLSKRMKTNYYYHTREWPYKNVRPRILAEHYLNDPNRNDLYDYKLLVFNGVVKCSFVCSNRFTGQGLRVTFFDKEWNRMPFERKYPADPNMLAKPEKYDEMVRLAETLAGNLPFMRVDFYVPDNRIFVGELTLFPGSGMEPFSPEQWDTILGSYLLLPKASPFAR